MRVSRGIIGVPLLLPLALTATVLITGCSQSVEDVSREAAVQTSHQTGAAPEGYADETTPAEGPMVGGPMDLTRLPFAVVNKLPVSVHIRVKDVDPYDWSTGAGIGTPLDLEPTGLNGAILAPGTSATGVFEPKSTASGAPFRLTLTSQVGSFPFTKSEPLADVAFNKVFYCERLPIAQQVGCAFPARQHWKGWSYRGGDKLSLSDQYPQVCGRTTEPFTYHLDEIEHRAQGRLDCASAATAGLGTALVLEDIS